MAKVTGIGGVFLLARQDSKALIDWYAKHLGFDLEDFGGALLRWGEDEANDGGLTVWHVGDPDSTWFAPSDSRFMINYRIDDMDGMLEQLRAADVDILQGPEQHENGRFAWILDPEGNKVELWEPRAWSGDNA